LLFAGMSLGSTLAGPVAIGLAIHYGWRFAFVGTSALAAAWAPLWLWATRRGPTRSAVDDPGEASERAPMLQVLAHPAMLRGLVGLLAIVPASAFAMAWEAKYYVRQFGMPLGALRPYVVASAVAYDAGAILFGDLASRRQRGRSDGSPPRLLFAAGACLAVAGLAGLALAGSPHVALGFFLASAAGRGAVVTLCNTDAIARLPQRSVAAAGGIIASVQSLGAIVTNPLLGAAVGSSGGYEQALLAIAAWTVPGSVSWLLWRPPPLQAAQVDART
ncbi:MAG TPA: MFS transporter, partial [Polyangiaceae bacterium]|nr:MFS transporter [Polyangiaceae bacterium]